MTKLDYDGLEKSRERVRAIMVRIPGGAWKEPKLTDPQAIIDVIKLEAARVLQCYLTGGGAR